MRFTSGDVRDHIVSSKIDHGPPWWRCKATQQQKSPKINFREISRAVRFSTFATISAPLRHPDRPRECPLMGLERKSSARGSGDANDRPSTDVVTWRKFCKFQFSSLAGTLTGAAPFLNMLEHLSANLDNTLIPNSQIARGPERKVEDAVTNVWSAVCNANNH
jgi:hypothetical protein